MLSDRRAKLCHILRDKEYYGAEAARCSSGGEDDDGWHYRLLVKVKTHLRDINEAHIRLDCQNRRIGDGGGEMEMFLVQGEAIYVSVCGWPLVYSLPAQTHFTDDAEAIIIIIIIICSM